MLAQPAARPWCVVLVLLALVCAQALGLMHRHAHGPSAPAGHAAHLSQASPHEGGAGWLHEIFAVHDDETDCRLYDALSPQVFAVQAVATLPVITPPKGCLRLRQGDFVARWAALYDARGPPATR